MAASEELIKIAARIVLQQVATPYRAALERRIIVAVICGLVALIVVIAAITCGIAAFWLWLTPMLGPTAARRSSGRVPNSFRILSTPCSTIRAAVPRQPA